MTVSELIALLLQAPNDCRVYVQSYDGFCTNADSAIIHTFDKEDGSTVVITSDRASEDNVYR